MQKDRDLGMRGRCTRQRAKGCKEEKRAGSLARTALPHHTASCGNPPRKPPCRTALMADSWSLCIKPSQYFPHSNLPLSTYSSDAFSSHASHKPPFSFTLLIPAPNSSSLPSFCSSFSSPTSHTHPFPFSCSLHFTRSILPLTLSTSIPSCHLSATPPKSSQSLPLANRLQNNTVSFISQHNHPSTTLSINLLFPIHLTMAHPLQQPLPNLPLR